MSMNCRSYGRACALDHADIGGRIELPALKLTHIARQAKDAVRIRAGEVGLQHGAGRDRGVGGGKPAGNERIGHVRLQGVRRDAAGHVSSSGHVRHFHWAFHINEKMAVGKT